MASTTSSHPAKKCPIGQLTLWRKDNDQLSEGELEQIEQQIKLEILEAVTFAENSKYEPEESLSDFVYSQYNTSIIGSKVVGSHDYVKLPSSNT